MKLAFAGTPDFAARSLLALLGSRHEIVLVLTRMDKPAGRGMELSFSPVKMLARGSGCPLRQPASLKDPAEQQALARSGAQIMVVAAYGLILPQAMLDIPRNGAINVHASLLPRWRGAAPIQRALLAGDRETGISIMQMDAGLDTGPVLLSEATPITGVDTAGSLHERLAGLGARLIVRALDTIESGAARPETQDEKRATYARKLQKSEARIDWNRDAESVQRQIRAFDPSPGCFTVARGIELKLWQAETVPAAAASAGEIIEADERGILVACGSGAIRLTVLQRPGGRKLGAGEFLRGFALRRGEHFDP
jgi:methionyl-tRNA formyltransferase